MTAALGPVSAFLESELSTQVRQHGVVVWLDLDGHYSALVDRLVELRAAEELRYEVKRFRGSHLELMCALESLGGGLDEAPLVVHLPGFNDQTVRLTPLFELYAAGTRFRRALRTAVSEAAAGRVRQELIADFCEKGPASLEDADAWLAAMIDERGGGLAGQLRTMRAVAVLDDLLVGGFVAGRLSVQEDQDCVWEAIDAWIGLPRNWRETMRPVHAVRAEDVAFTAASWALGVEYVDDLRRDPVDDRLKPAKVLPRGVIQTCREIAVHLRERHAAFYQRTADETEAVLEPEVEAARAEDLGQIDTFRFEEEKVLEAALTALGGAQWAVAGEWAARRSCAEAFWLREDPPRQSAWQLVRDAAELGCALDAAGSSLGAVQSLESAVERYVQLGAAVDRAHRHLEQRRVALLYPQLPEFEILRARLDELRMLWRRWADGWAREFNSLCRATGFLPGSAQQQRALFDDVVRPFTQESGTTALFMVDALRYEMGEELRAALADTPATLIQLKARLAELPTVTEVGMNVLAPVAERGRLRPALIDGVVRGFSTGEYRVSDPESRKRAMQSRVGGDTCPSFTLDDVLARASTSLKQAVARARLVIVHSQEIDAAGEKGMGPAVFDHVMQKLRAAWRLLRDAGVRRFVITADHGFLLLDESASTAQAHGRKIDPKRRHVFSSVAADHTGEVRVALADLGYEGAEGHLMFPDTTAVFDTGRRSMSFVHGGNSLQERVIPVLTLVHRVASGASNLQYAIAARALDEVAGMHCITAQVKTAGQTSLGFSRAAEVELALEVIDAAEVQVELCQARGGARLEAGVVVAKVDESFELFFRLLGRADARVSVELRHPTAEVDVASCRLEGRFAVAAARNQPRLPEAGEMEPQPAAPVEQTWLAELPSPGIRQLFEHLALHGAVTEGEAANILGGPRALRRFALAFEEHAARAPFLVRIDVVAGVKRYVREGKG